MSEEATEFGKYLIFQQLGRGGFATVYRARDTELGRDVALKILHPELLTDASFVTRFRQEAKTLASLRHRHIITIFEMGEIERRLYIAMELARGNSLAHEIASRGRIPWDETLALLQPICAALDYAHAHNVIHRDLKPSNVLLDTEGGALLSDFGFARLVSQRSASQTLSKIVGTASYIAPEVWKKQPTDAPADRYALACIVPEMLTGQVLFSGEDYFQVVAAHYNGPTFPNPWPEDVPPGINAVLSKALAADPAARYPSALAFWQALHELEAPHATAAALTLAPLLDAAPDAPTLPQAELPTLAAAAVPVEEAQTTVVASQPEPQPLAVGVAAVPVETTPATATALPAAEVSSASPGAPGRRIPIWLIGLIAVLLLGGAAWAAVRFLPIGSANMPTPTATAVDVIVATAAATAPPTAAPTPEATAPPTAAPTLEATVPPTAAPAPEATSEPSVAPTEAPTSAPTETQVADIATVAPTADQSLGAAVATVAQPTAIPTIAPQAPQSAQGSDFQATGNRGTVASGGPCLSGMVLTRSRIPFSSAEVLIDQGGNSRTVPVNPATGAFSACGLNAGLWGIAIGTWNGNDVGNAERQGHQLRVELRDDPTDAYLVQFTATFDPPAVAATATPGPFDGIWKGTLSGTTSTGAIPPGKRFDMEVRNNALYYIAVDGVSCPFEAYPNWPDGIPISSSGDFKVTDSPSNPQTKVRDTSIQFVVSGRFTGNSASGTLSATQNGGSCAEATWRASK